MLLAATGCGVPEPAVCDDHSPGQDVVDTFWRTLDRHYAVFDLRLGADSAQRWEALGQTACATVVDDSDDTTLFATLLSLAQALDDGHVQIESPNRDADGWVSVYPHADAMAQLRDNVQARYASAPLVRDGLDAHAWGLLDAPSPDLTLGYWSIDAMDDLTTLDDETADVAAANQIADAVFGDLGDVDCLVLDIRNNEGGWDAVSLVLAQRFAGPASVGWSKATRAGVEHDAFSGFRDVALPASDADAFAGRVVLVTSGATFSAAETFALAMRQRDAVTILGEPSSGHFSDLYDGELPNGWAFTYSGDRYRTADGTLVETRGVAVDVSVAFDAVAFADGRDSMLQAAIDHCQQ